MAVLPDGAPPLRNAPAGKREALAIMRQKSLEMRVQEHTFTEIASTLGIGLRTAKRHVRRALDRIVAASDGDAARYRELLLQRLEAAYKFAYARAKGGDVEAVNAIVGIVDRMARLVGADKVPAVAGASAAAGLVFNITPVAPVIPPPNRYPPVDAAPVDAPAAALQPVCGVDTTTDERNSDAS
ncbi:MAG TPA: hypothetical protein VHQ47_07510 [Phycisphaerae bacterium]|nr:hypothetical protein [Phycisphaerae bacterium]